MIKNVKFGIIFELQEVLGVNKKYKLLVNT